MSVGEWISTKNDRARVRPWIEWHMEEGHRQRLDQTKKSRINQGTKLACSGQRARALLLDHIQLLSYKDESSPLWHQGWVAHLLRLRAPWSVSDQRPRTRRLGRAFGRHGRYRAVWWRKKGKQDRRVDWRSRDNKCIFSVQYRLSEAYLTMLSSFNSFNRLISRMAVLGTPSSSASRRIFLRATIWFDEVSRAL